MQGLGKAGLFKDVNLTLRSGEILALTGLRGCGAPEICKAIFGLDSDVVGRILYHGQPLDLREGPSRRVAQHMGFVSENRDKNGIMAVMSVADNILLPYLEKRASFGFLRSSDANRVVADAMQNTAVKAASPQVPIRSLSGGNKQKICFSRWLDEDLSLLILLEPTRGIDVHAKADIYRIIETLAARGVAVLILSYEVDEVVMVADRVIALFQGQVVGDYGVTEIDKNQLLADMVGARV